MWHRSSIVNDFTIKFRPKLLCPLMDWILSVWDYFSSTCHNTEDLSEAFNMLPCAFNIGLATICVTVVFVRGIHQYPAERLLIMDNIPSHP